MKAKYYIKNVNDLVIPKRANSSDAGYDVVATTPGNIVGETWSGINHTSYLPYKKIDYIEYGTNLYIAPQTFPFTTSRSSGCQIYLKRTSIWFL